MKIVEGEICPGYGIGKYLLGDNLVNILDKIIGEYKESEEEDGSSVIMIDNAGFWFDKNKRLTQIGVTYGFLGKYCNVGIGDTLVDVKENIGSFYEEYDDYLIKGVKGLAIALDDNDDYDSEWDEMNAPIEWIFVYKV